MPAEATEVDMRTNRPDIAKDTAVIFIDANGRVREGVAIRTWYDSKALTRRVDCLLTDRDGHTVAVSPHLDRVGVKEAN